MCTHVALDHLGLARYALLSEVGGPQTLQRSELVAVVWHPLPRLVWLARPTVQPSPETMVQSGGSPHCGPLPSSAGAELEPRTFITRSLQEAARKWAEFAGTFESRTFVFKSLKRQKGVSVQLVGGHNLASSNLGVWSGLRRRRSMTLGVRSWSRCCCGWIVRSSSWPRGLIGSSGSCGRARGTRRSRRVRTGRNRRRGRQGPVGSQAGRAARA